MPGLGPLNDCGEHVHLAVPRDVDTFHTIRHVRHRFPRPGHFSGDLADLAGYRVLEEVADQLGVSIGSCRMDECGRTLAHACHVPSQHKCTDAPRTTKSMHVVIEDLGLAHLWVLYPGNQEYPLTDTISALPLKQVSNIDI